MQQIGNGTVDVVTSSAYHWTVSNSTKARDQVPRILISEFQQTATSIAQGIKYWSNQLSGLIATNQTSGRGELTSKKPPPDPYAQLYSVDNSEFGNTYVFPFYCPQHHTITNSWGENKGTIGGYASKISSIATEAGRVLFPSAGIESAKAWEGSTPYEYTFSFQLLNTVDPVNDKKNNQELIRVLINNNLLDKVDFLAVRPPAICQVTVPGIRGKTVAVMRNIVIENLGQINRIAGENIPDAYGLTITIQELLTESRQIWGNQLGNVFAFVEGATSSVQEALQNPADAALRAIGL